MFPQKRPTGKENGSTQQRNSNFVKQDAITNRSACVVGDSKLNLEHLVPHLSDELKSPLDWWEKAYRPGLHLIQQPWRDVVQERTEKWLPYMQDEKKLQCVNLFPQYPV